MDRTDGRALTRAVIGLCMFVVVVIGLVPIWSLPDDLLQTVERLDSTAAELPFEDVPRGTDIGTGASVPLTPGQTTHWLRITIDPPPEGGEVLVRLRPVTLDRATLYLRNADGTWRSIETGEMVDPQQRSWPSLLRHVLLIDDIPARTTAFVKLESQSPVAVFLSAYPVATALQIDIRTMAFHAFVFGLKIISILLILLTLPKQNNRVNLNFFALELGSVFYLALNLGYAQALFHNIPPAWIDYLSAAAVGLIVLISTQFHRTLLTRFDPAPVAHGFSLVPVLLAGIGLVCVLAGFRLAGLGLTAIGYLTLVPAILALLVTMKGDAPPGRRMVRIIYGLYLPLLMTNLATTVGLVRIDWFYRNGPEFLSLFNSTLILALILTMNRALNAEWLARRGRIRQEILANRAENKIRRAEHFLTQLVAQETRCALGQLQNILSCEGGPVRSAALGRAMTALDGIITDCLQADEAETGVWRTTAAPFDIAAMLRDLSRDAGAGAVSIRAPDSVTLVSDANLVAVVLRHLLTNAMTYAEPGTPIAAHATKSLRYERSGVAMTVSNTVPEDIRIDLERIFEKFFRGTQSSTTSGTGLGLFICREITSTLGGTIHAEVSGRIVSFHLWLPDR